MVCHDCIVWFFARDGLSSQQVSVGCRGKEKKVERDFWWWWLVWKMLKVVLVEELLR
jgi:hypothetical protein